MAKLQKDIPQHDITAFTKLIPVLKAQVEDGISVVEKIRAKYTDGDLKTASGITFLELKNQLMLSYLQNMTLLMLKKASGVSIHEDPATLRLVEIRTVLERMRPIETKLKYHIDKLLKKSFDNEKNKSDSNNLDGQDPLSFRPNPDRLMNTLNTLDGVGATGEVGEIDEIDGVGEDTLGDVDGVGEVRLSDTLGTSNETAVGKKRQDVYVPPRMAAVPYNFDETPKDRAQKKTEREKKRALHSSIMQELRQEYYDEPEEIHDRDIFRVKSDKKAKEREVYEERNMTRLNVSKKEKDRAKRVTTMNSLKYLTDFGDFRGMTGGGDEAGGSGGIDSSKKRKNTSQKKGKKSKKFKKNR